MSMKNKHGLTEQLKVLETEVHAKKLDLSSINAKLGSNYAYQDELAIRVQQAKRNENELREEFIKKSQEIAGDYKKMKDILDVFTGNFYATD